MIFTVSAVFIILARGFAFKCHSQMFFAERCNSARVNFPSERACNVLSPVEAKEPSGQTMYKSFWLRIIAAKLVLSSGFPNSLMLANQSVITTPLNPHSFLKIVVFKS